MSSIILQQYQSEGASDQPKAFSLTLRSVGEDDFPSEIFVFRKGLPLTLYARPMFMNIATVLQLEEYPTQAEFENDPESYQNPFYRSNEVVLVFNTPTEREETRGLILKDIQNLLSDYKASNTPVFFESSRVTESSITAYTHEDGLTTVQIGWYPSGEAAVDVDGNQSILNPVPGGEGWLPTTLCDTAVFGPIPEGVEYFYNYTPNTSLAAIFPLQSDPASYIVTYNGTPIAPEALTLTSKGLFWKTFAPGTLPFEFEGNAPWPSDYATNPDSYLNPPVIELILPV